MNHHNPPKSLPAPCIVNTGTIVNKDDIERLLKDMLYVRYIYTIDNSKHSEGTGRLREVFINPHQSTIIANGNLYINIQSFDYLQLSQRSPTETYFDLIQENCQLRLVPVSRSGCKTSMPGDLDEAAIEVMVAEVLSARLDVQFDDEEL